MIIAKNSADERVITAILLFLIVNLVVAILYVFWMGRREAAGRIAMEGLQK